MADGSVIIKVDADEKAAVRKLHKVEAEIDKLQAKLNEKQAGRSAVLQDIEELQKKISPLRQELRKAKEEWLSGGERSAMAGTRHSELQAQIAPLQAQLEALYQQVEKYDKEIDGITPKLEEQKRIYGETQIQVAQLTRQNTALENASEKVAESADRFYNRVKGLAKRVFVFTVITAAFRQLRDHMALAVKTNAEATSAFAQLKGAVLVLVQPLVELLLPALTWVAQALTKVVSVLAQLFTLITGKSFASMKQSAKALNEEKKALEGVGKAADKASGSLAGFDEINTINTTESGAGGANGASVAIQPDFDFDGEMEMENLNNILRLVEMIGLAFLAWKLPGNFLPNLLGLWLALEGLKGYVEYFRDILENGMNLENMLGLLSHAALLVGGLGIAFGKNGLAVGFLVTGIGELIAGFQDAEKNGLNFHNTLTIIAGLLSSGLGISLLTGKWFPLVLAGIASVLLAIAVFTGNGEELMEGLRKVFGGFKDFISGVFSGDMEKAMEGLKQMWEGLKIAAKAILDSIKELWSKFSAWMDEKTNGWFSKLCRGIVEGLYSFINLIIRGLNKLIDGLNKINISFPDWIPIIGGKRFAPNIKRLTEIPIPALATGAVVPPNREFLAMLGDNKTETEVVSPLSTMKQAMLEALRESGGYGGGTYQFQLFVNGRQMAVEMVKEINTMTAQSGKSMIKIPR